MNYEMNNMDLKREGGKMTLESGLGSRAMPLGWSISLDKSTMRLDPFSRATSIVLRRESTQ